MHLVKPNRRPTGQQLDSYLSTKMLEMCLSKLIMKQHRTLKVLTADNKLSIGHSQQNYIFLKKNATSDKTTVFIIERKKKKLQKQKRVRKRRNFTFCN